MIKFWALLAKDMKLVLARPSSLAFLAIFAISAGALTFYPGRFFDADRADLSQLFATLPWLLALLTPALAMDGLSAERRSGMAQWLYALPLRPGLIVLAKWLSAWLLCLAALALTMTLWASILWLGRPDNGAIVAGYLGAALMAAAYCAAVLAASAGIGHQALAFLAALAVNIVITIGALPVFGFLPAPLPAVLADFAVPVHQMHFVRGVLSLTDAGFFISLCLLGLYAATLLWRWRRGAAGRLLMALGLTLGVNVFLASAPLRTLRLDMTAAHLYRLSPAAKGLILAQERPLEWTFYFSRSLASHYPDIRSYGARIEETLRSFAEVSKGRIRVHMVDPGVDNRREDAAIKAGMQPLPTDRNQPLYMGLAEGDHARIARFDPARARLLEYDLARALDQTRAARPLLALYDGIDLAGKDWFVSGRRQSQVFERLEKRYRVRLLKDDFGAAELAGHLLMLVHPPAFAPKQQSALDDFVAGGGRVLVFLDPYSEVSARPNLDGLPRQGARMASTAPDFLKQAGLSWSAAKIVLDREGAMPVQRPKNSQGGQGRQPAWIGVLPSRLAANEPLSGPLQRGLVMASAAELRTKDKSGWRALAWSSTNAALLPASFYAAGPDPAALMRTPPADGRRHWLGAIRGGVVVFGDADMLDDGFYVHDDPVFGPRAQADNADLVMAALERLAGSDALLALRARPAPLRRLSRIDAMRAEARQRYQEAEAKAGDTPDAAASRALREVRQRFARQLRGFETLLEMINIWLAPALVVGLGGSFMFWRRHRLSRRRPVRRRSSLHHGETGSGPAN